MGCLISSLISSCLCSTASCCVSQTCNCCGKVITGRSVSKSIATRVMYAVQLLLFAVIAWIFNNLPYWSENSWILSKIPGLQSCENDKSCSGTMGVYRITAAMAFYHAFFAVLFIKVRTSEDPRASIQDGWWFFKFLFLVLLVVVSFLIPSTAFVGYGWISLIGAALFVLVQLVLLVDLAHSLQESWVGKYERTGDCIWAFLLLGGSIAIYIVGVTGYTLMYIFFNQCTFNTILITVNVVSLSAATILSISPCLQARNPRSGLFQSAVVTIFATYLIGSAIMAEPETMHCKKWNTNGSIITTLLGVAFSFLAVGYNVFNASSSSRDFGIGSRKSEDGEASEAARQHLDEMLAVPANSTSESSPTSTSDAHETVDDASAPLLERSEDLIAEREGKKPKRIINRVNDGETDEEMELDRDDERSGVTYSYSFFHLIFLLAALYLNMILTNWQHVSKEEKSSKLQVDYGITSVWVKVASAWLVILLYVWTLVAPVIFPDRQWA